MSEIVTYDTQAEALAYRPFRYGFEFRLYQHPTSSLYQWLNNPFVAQLFNLKQIYPVPAGLGFGLIAFGTDPFGS